MMKLQKEKIYMKGKIKRRKEKRRKNLYERGKKKEKKSKKWQLPRDTLIGQLQKGPGQHNGGQPWAGAGCC
jgi:hypothetical protein